MATINVYNNSNVYVNDSNRVAGIGKFPSGTTVVKLNVTNKNDTQINVSFSSTTTITSTYSSGAFVGTGYNWTLVLKLYSDSARTKQIAVLKASIKPYRANGGITSWSKDGSNSGWNLESDGIARHRGPINANSQTATVNKTDSGTIYWYLTSEINGWNPGYSISGQDIVTDGRPNLALYETSYNGRTYSSNNRPANYGSINTGFPRYKKATISISSTRAMTTNSGSNIDISRNNETVRVYYGASSYSSADKTRIQYSIDGHTWHSPANIYYQNGSSYTSSSNSNYSNNSNKAGYFEYTPSSVGISTGRTYTLYIRRIHSGGSSYNSSNDTKRMYTYTTVSISSGKVSINPVNANVSDTVSWSSWSSSTKHSKDVCTCSISVYTNNKSTLISNISSGLTGTSYSYTFRNYIPTLYDNTQVQIKVIRTNTGSKLSAEVWIPITVRYRPIQKITNLNPSNGINYIIEPISNSLSISWKYGYSISNQYGIVSGYKVVLNTDSDTITRYVSTNGSTSSDSSIPSENSIAYSTATTFMINGSNLIYTKIYSISIIPFYMDGNNKIYNANTETIVYNYVIRETRLNNPVIVLPLSGNWYNIGLGSSLSTRLVISLPTDNSYSYRTTEEQNNYRYEDIEININGIPYLYSEYADEYFSIPNDTNNKFPVGRYNDYIVFKCSLVDGNLSNYNIKVRIKKDSNLIPADNQYAWSEYSNIITLNNIEFTDTQYGDPNSLIGSTIYDNMSIKYPITYLDNVISDLSYLYKISFDSNTPYNNTIIRASTFIIFYNTLSDISDTVYNYLKIGDNYNVCFPELESGDLSTNKIIKSIDENPSNSGYVIRTYNWIRSMLE